MGMAHLSNCILLRAAAVRFACSSPRGVRVESLLSPCTHSVLFSQGCYQPRNTGLSIGHHNALSGCVQKYIARSIHDMTGSHKQHRLAWMRFCSFQVVMPCLTKTTVFSCVSSWSTRDMGPGFELDPILVEPVLYRLLEACSWAMLPLLGLSRSVTSADCRCALHIEGCLHRLRGAGAGLKALCGSHSCIGAPAAWRYR